MASGRHGRTDSWLCMAPGVQGRRGAGQQGCMAAGILVFLYHRNPQKIMEHCGNEGL